MQSIYWRTPLFTPWTSGHKLLKSHSGSFLLVLPEGAFVLNTYLLNFPTSKSNKALSQGNLGAKDRAKLRDHVKLSRAVFKREFIFSCGRLRLAL